MNGELAQLVFLVAHGNLFLYGGDIAGTDFSTNSTFQYVSSVKFARYKSNQDTHGVGVASSVSGWLTFLRSIKVTRLWNIAFAWERQDIPEHVAVAFAGYVPIAIQADLPNGFELWYPRWETGGHSDKPWLVEYRSLMFPNSHVLPSQELNKIKKQLRKAVLRIEKFSKRSDINSTTWTNRFTKSLELLDSPNPKIPFHPDILPNFGFNLEARQVLASAMQSYVFGGMGSWNDMGFNNPKVHKEYERVTKELYDAVKLAIVMASNSFLP